MRLYVPLKLTSSRLTRSLQFFHPSNSGHWSAFLTIFLSHLSSNFAERWKAEEEPSCKTPVEWRLTAAMKREFVLVIRPLALTAMFNKVCWIPLLILRQADHTFCCVGHGIGDPGNLSSEEASASRAGPDHASRHGASSSLAARTGGGMLSLCMMSSLLTDAVSEQTQRTPAVTFALAALAQPFAARQIWRHGGMFVADTFALLLPGIDLNDPGKTGLSCMAISNMVDFIRLSDISEVEDSAAIKVGSRALRPSARPTVEDDANDSVPNELEDLSSEDVHGRVRFATAAFRDWVPDFLGRVLLLFSNLPEEGGKSGRAGGKTEAMTLHSVLVGTVDPTP